MRCLVFFQVTQCWKSRGLEAAISEATRTGDTIALVELLDALSQTPTAWNLSLCASVLPHIEVLLTRKNDDCIEVNILAYLLSNISLIAKLPIRYFQLVSRFFSQFAGWLNIRLLMSQSFDDRQQAVGTCSHEFHEFFCY